MVATSSSCIFRLAAEAVTNLADEAPNTLASTRSACRIKLSRALVDWEAAAGRVVANNCVRHFSLVYDLQNGRGEHL